MSSYTQEDTVPDLAYSSTESIKETILTGKGVYQSRKHGLWMKGKISRAVQEVVKIRLGCDSDAPQFSVIRHGEGFCHPGRSSCFGELSGLAAQRVHARYLRAGHGMSRDRVRHTPKTGGTLSPEVFFFLRRWSIGTPATPKADGAQAIAALAYGTEKVTNESWLRRRPNNAGALVSIDMPASPSEVLVCGLNS